MRTFQLAVLPFVSIAVAVALCQRVPLQAMDEWNALLISLRTAKSITPRSGFVPDAVRIAEAAATAQFGEETIKAERPFKARLYGDIWIIKGTLHPAGAFGGTAVVKVRKDDGKITFMVHQY